MTNYKGVRCFNCDSVILAHTGHIAPHPFSNGHLQILHCPACSAITLQVSASEAKPYLMPRAVRQRGYAKKGEWQEMGAH